MAGTLWLGRQPRPGALGIRNGPRPVQRYGLARRGGAHVRTGYSSRGRIQEPTGLRFRLARTTGVSGLVSWRPRSTGSVRRIGEPAVKFVPCESFPRFELVRKRFGVFECAAAPGFY